MVLLVTLLVSTITNLYDLCIAFYIVIHLILIGGRVRVKMNHNLEVLLS